APLIRQATELAAGIAVALELEGLLAVEMFLTTRDELLVNDLAPRPHNLFHETDLGRPTTQFELLVRAVVTLPTRHPSVVWQSAIASRMVVSGSCSRRGSTTMCCAASRRPSSSRRSTIRTISRASRRRAPRSALAFRKWPCSIPPSTTPFPSARISTRYPTSGIGATAFGATAS